MKWMDWILAAALIVMGMFCLMMSAVSIPYSWTNDLQYLRTALKICIWIGLPSIIVGFIYLIVKHRRPK